MRDFIVAQRKRRTIVISASHNLHEIELLCDHVAFVEKGRTVRSGPIDAITGSRGVLVRRRGRAPPEESLAAACPAPRSSSTRTTGP